MYESLKEYFRTRGILLVIVIKARQTLRRHDHGWYLYKINFHWLSPLSIYTALGQTAILLLRERGSLVHGDSYRT